MTQITDKDLLRFGYAPGKYQFRCACGELAYDADKRALRCRPCAVKLWQAAQGSCEHHINDRERVATVSGRPAEQCKACGQPVTPFPHQPQSAPMGCICPPGANKDCEAPLCPRKPISIR